MVIGVFPKTDNAEKAIYELEKVGFNPKDISIVMKSREEVERVSDNTGASVAGGALSGATAGGVLGGLAGLLVATGVVPGLGVLLIGGPLAAALGLTGAAATTVAGAVTGALAGGVLGALSGLGLSDDDARYFEDRIRHGGVLVAVPASPGVEHDVVDILKDYGADQVKTIRAREERYYEPTYGVLGGEAEVEEVKPKRRRP